MLFAATIFLNAFLLFLLEPMFAKMALPRLGGTAAVWTTCVMFFQTALVGGYLYAHVLGRVRKVRIQLAIHVGLLLIVALTLPLSIPSTWSPRSDASPVFGFLGLLVRRLGGAFTLLAAGSPLIQAWATSSRVAERKDPYGLYASSNIGSFAALIAYPVLFEPQLTLSSQSVVWTVGYFTLLGALIACGILAAIRRNAPASVEAGPPGSISFRDRARWLLFSAVPSSLLLGVTTHITTDLAGIPLFWIIPLACYLATFIVAFSESWREKSRAIDRSIPYLAIAVAGLLFLRAEIPGIGGYIIHVVAFAILALTCHRRLAESRPHSARLTEFYLWIAIGGALGAAFNTLIAPKVFATVAEYPLALILAIAISRRVSGWKASDFLLPAGLAIALWLLSGSTALAGRFGERPISSVAIVLAGLVAFASRERSVRFALSLAALLFVGNVLSSREQKSELRARSFYGVYEVVRDEPAHAREFFSGTTVHGAQRFDDVGHIPLTYYHRDGPLGAFFSSPARDDVRSVGVVGLGVGSTAAYARAGEQWTFYEIDPLVVQIASDQRYFGFLSHALTEPRIVLGDARVSISHEPPGAFDLLLVDAFSSDAIPVHLITREALALYRSRLKPSGMIVWHISNRYLDLQPVLEALADNAGLRLLTYDQRRLPAKALGRFPADWIVMTDSIRASKDFSPATGWRVSHSGKAPRLWTDDFSNLLQALR